MKNIICSNLRRLNLKLANMKYIQPRISFVNIFNSRNFTTQTENENMLTSDLNKLIKDQVHSIYNTKQTEVNHENESEEEKNYAMKKNQQPIFDIEKIKLNLSEFLKSLEFSRTFDIKHSKYFEARRSIPMLNKDDVKKSLFEILSDPQIKQLKEDELTIEVANMLAITQSYETVLDEKYYSKLITFLQEIGKFFLKNDIYAVDHTVNVTSNTNKQLLLKFGDVKSILEFVNFADLKDEQLLKVFPIIVMLNNLYNVSEMVMEKVINEILSRLFSPIKNIKNEKSQSDELFKSYLLFIIVNNYVSHSHFYLKYLIVYKDIIIRNYNLHDLIFLLTDNIFKFINTHGFQSDLVLFEEFIHSYLACHTLMENTNEINVDLLESFFNSLLLLHNFNSNLPEENQILSKSLKMQFSLFIKDSIFKFVNKDTYSNWVAAFLQKESNLELLMEVENKICSDSPLFTFIESYINPQELKFERFLKIVMSALDHNQNSSMKNLIHLMTPRILKENIENKFTIQEFNHLLKVLGKFKVEEIKRIYEIGYGNHKYNLKSLNITDLSDLLIQVAQYNLIDVYENYPPYLLFIMKINSSNYIQTLSNGGVDLIWTMALFGLRLKEFNPVFKLFLSNLPILIKNNVNSETSTESLNKILQIFAMTELMMKYNLTDVDYSQIFTAELITSILNLYISKSETNNKYLQLENLLFARFKNKDHLKLILTNLEYIPTLFYKEFEIPVILVNDSDFNMDKKLQGKYYVQFYHCQSYLNTPPMILNVDKLENIEDIEKEINRYTQAPKNAYKKYLD